MYDSLTHTTRPATSIDAKTMGRAIAGRLIPLALIAVTSEWRLRFHIV